MLVGEIGIPRREYLYDLTYCDIVLIVRGYLNRQHPAWEQARLIAYHVRYCMGSKETPPTLTEWLTFPWERRDDGEPVILPSEAEVQRLRQMMIEENARAEAAQAE